MKVIVTSPVWSLNGVNSFSVNLVRGLRDRGVSARILLTGATYRERKPMPFPQDISIEHLVLPALASWRRRWRTLIGYLESEAPCIYLPNHDFQHSCVSPALSTSVGIVGIVHSDDAQHYDHAERLGRTWNATVAVSQRIAERLLERGWIDPSRLSMIPYGIRPAAEPVSRTWGQDLRLLYTGRLDGPQKRVGDLLEIACALTARNVAFSLTIVGDGPERAFLERSIRERGLAERVTLVPTVEMERVLALCAEHDAFLLTSAYEGMPISLLEAMGQGCVPFASDVESGVPELIQDGQNGFIVRTGDVDGFASVLAEFAISPATRQHMSLQAWRSVVEGGYSIDSMTSRYLELFNRVWKEIADRSFSRGGTGSVQPVKLSMRERVAATLWSLRPSLRAQQNPDK